MPTLLGPTAIATITTPTPGTTLRVGQTVQFTVQVASGISIGVILGTIYNPKIQSDYIVGFWTPEGTPPAKPIVDNVATMDWTPAKAGIYDVTAAVYPVGSTAPYNVPTFVVQVAPA